MTGNTSAVDKFGLFIYLFSLSVGECSSWGTVGYFSKSLEERTYRGYGLWLGNFEESLRK